MHRPHIILIGLSGAGKSATAGLLATMLGWPQRDTDALIVARAGCSIAALFAGQGETAFRDMETTVLREVLEEEQGGVIAAGGGVVVRPENRVLIRQRAWAAWLDAPAATLAARLAAHNEERPLVRGADALAHLARLRSEREPLYRGLAATIIDTSGLMPEEVAGQIVAAWRASMY